jgi:hypothetical protein
VAAWPPEMRDKSHEAKCSDRMKGVFIGCLLYRRLSGRRLRRQPGSAKKGRCWKPCRQEALSQKNLQKFLFMQASTVRIVHFFLKRMKYLFGFKPARHPCQPTGKSRLPFWRPGSPLPGVAAQAPGAKTPRGSVETKNVGVKRSSSVGPQRNPTHRVAGPVPAPRKQEREHGSPGWIWDNALSGYRRQGRTRIISLRPHMSQPRHYH